MAITRRSALSKEQDQATPAPPLPPPPAATDAEINSNSHNNNEQPLQQQEQQQEQSPVVVSDYEQTREQRIKENRERLQKLGIVDLSLQLKSIVATKRTPRRTTFDRKTPSKSPSLNPPESIRRSSRLQNVPTVTYVELKEEKPKRSRDIVLEEGAKPELYTEEHEKLLGTTEMPWTFFVDGYRADGTRIYDSVAGKTCHQCRQKTLGQRTCCSKCNLVQGQFCGDCLMMRYGEHVVEANQNPNWICPPCRGICNCSLCRQARGWAPTGALYKRINNLGYKSVAHYLITTKRAPPDSEKNSDAQQSAKRALPFEGMEVPNGNGSGDEALVEKNELNPQSESESMTVGESDPKPRGAGRPRKRSEKEGADGSGDEAVVEKTELNPQSEREATTVDKSDPKPRGVGRPRKISKKESTDGSGDGGVVEKTEINPQSESEATTVGDSDPKPRGAGRPRKRSEKEGADGSGDEAVVEKTELNPQSEREATTVGKSDPKPRGVGRPRKISKKESTDGSGDGGVVEKTEINPQSESEATTVGDSDPKPRGAGRPRKRSEKEGADGSGDEAVVEKTELNPQSERKATTVGKSDPKPRGVVRPRKISKKESTDGSGDGGVVEKTEINPQSESEATTVGDSDPKPRGVGRPRKRSKNESSDAREESMKESEGAESKPVPNVNGPNSSTSTIDKSNSKPAVRRSVRGSMQENVDVGELSAKTNGTPGEEPASIMKSPNNSESKVDGFARRLRSRSKA